MAVDWGAVGTIVPGLGGLGLGTAAFVFQRRDARAARVERQKTAAASASAEASAAGLAERSQAFDEMAEALERLGDAVERADRRASDCEQREEKLLDRLRAVEKATGLSP